MSEMYHETCIACGIKYCMPVERHNRLYITKDTFYCPNGHPQAYIGESHKAEVKRLNKIINAKDDRIDRLRAQVQRLKIAKGRWRGIATRLRES